MNHEPWTMVLHLSLMCYWDWASRVTSCCCAMGNSRLLGLQRVITSNGGMRDAPGSAIIISHTPVQTGGGIATQVFPAVIISHHLTLLNYPTTADAYRPAMSIETIWKKLKLVFNLFSGGKTRLDGLSKTSSEKLIWVFQQLKSGWGVVKAMMGC